VPIPGRANERLDCRVYAYAALRGLIHLGLKLNREADKIGAAIGIIITSMRGNDEQSAVEQHQELAQPDVSAGPQKHEQTGPKPLGSEP
jgi:phage terminase large subunit GpA-like protein